jgi:hypothetical protein
MSCTVGINEMAALSNKLIVWPNPAADHFYFSAGNNNPVREVRIYDLRGSLVLEMKSSEIKEADCSLLSNGMYVLTVIAEKGIFQEKLLISGK